jgi:hypothetical protein
VGQAPGGVFFGQELDSLLESLKSLGWDTQLPNGD